VNEGPVLIICADHDLGQQLTSALAGIPLLLVSEGESAIEVLWDGNPVAVVVDFDLPRMSGYDVLRHLSMRRPELLKRTIVLIDPEDGTLPLIEDVPVGYRAPKPLDLVALARIVRRIADPVPAESSRDEGRTSQRS
jgi:DNA-binding NarL/FixJ family response regulator